MSTPPPHGLCVYCGANTWLLDNDGQPAHPCCVISQRFPRHEQCPCLQGAPTLEGDNDNERSSGGVPPPHPSTATATATTTRTPNSDLNPTYPIDIQPDSRYL